MKRLLAAGIAGILVVGLAPHARQAWDDYQLRRDEQARERFIALKEREIACLERLGAGNLEGVDVAAGIERCKELAIDPESGKYATRPPGR